MPQTPSLPRRLAARIDLLFHKHALRISRSRRIDGIWVGCYYDKQTFSDVFGRVEEALCLIKSNDPLRYNRVVRDIDHILVKLLPGALGQYNNSLKLCMLDERFVLGDATRSEQIAAAIVHEATHARLMRCGIGYDADLRARVEAVCFRRERAFAARLPDGEQVGEEAARRLTGYPPDYWTDEARFNRLEQGVADGLRYVGVPEFLIRALFGINRFVLRIKRFTRRLKYRFRA